MNRYRFPIAVAATSLALVAVLLGAGGLLVGNALANTPFLGAAVAAGGPWSGRWGGPPWAVDHAGWQLPPQLAGLGDVPAGERFSHFRGVQVQLTDKNNQPVSVAIVPGTTTSVTPTSLTMTTNEGAIRTFTLDDKTAIRGGGPGGTPTVKQNDQIVVVVLNNSSTATAVIIADGFGSHPTSGH